MNTQDPNIKDNNNFFALFKGPSGSGKTVAALSFPNPGHLDFDRKMPAIARKHFPKKSIEYYVYNNIFELADQITGWIEKDNCPHETLIGDSITSLAGMIIRSIAEVKGEQLPKMLSILKKTKIGKNMIEIMGFDYYKAEFRYIEWLIDALKILWSRPSNPKNVILTAHIMTTESLPDIETKVITKTRSIVTAGNKPAGYIPTQFDEVYNFGFSQVGGMTMNSESSVKYVMLSQLNGEDDAKTAFKLNRTTDFTNKSLYDELMKQIRGAEMFV